MAFTWWYHKIFILQVSSWAFFQADVEILLNLRNFEQSSSFGLLKAISAIKFLRGKILPAKTLNLLNTGILKGRVMESLSSNSIYFKALSFIFISLIIPIVHAEKGLLLNRIRSGVSIGALKIFIQPATVPGRKSKVSTQELVIVGRQKHSVQVSPVFSLLRLILLLLRPSEIISPMKSSQLSGLRVKQLMRSIRM